MTRVTWLLPGGSCLSGCLPNPRRFQCRLHSIRREARDRLPPCGSEVSRSSSAGVSKVVPEPLTAGLSEPWTVLRHRIDISIPKHIEASVPGAVLGGEVARVPKAHDPPLLTLFHLRPWFPILRTSAEPFSEVNRRQPDSLSFIDHRHP